MERYSTLAFNALRILADHNQSLQQRYQELLTEKVEQRVAQALIRLTEQLGQPVPNGILIDLPLSREELAEIAGTTLYSVSRILSKWEEQRWVESGRERVVVCNVAQIQTIGWPFC
jgi:CRP-like cAMP-binding protein